MQSRGAAGDEPLDLRGHLLVVQLHVIRADGIRDGLIILVLVGNFVIRHDLWEGLAGVGDFGQ